MNRHDSDRLHAAINAKHAAVSRRARLGNTRGRSGIGTRHPGRYI
jgi:hypothetical protein